MKLGWGKQPAQPGTVWVKTDDVRKALPRQAVLIEMVRITPTAGKPRYAAWVIPPAGAGAVRVFDLGDAAAVEADIAAVRKGLDGALTEIRRYDEANAEAELKKALTAVAVRLLRPLEPAISSYEEWVLSPDGPLWLLPWAALPLSDGRYAVEGHTLRLLISGRYLAQRLTETAGGQGRGVRQPGVRRHADVADGGGPDAGARPRPGAPLRNCLQLGEGRADREPELTYAIFLAQAEASRGWKDPEWAKWFAAKADLLATKVPPEVRKKVTDPRRMVRDQLKQANAQIAGRQAPEHEKLIELLSDEMTDDPGPFTPAERDVKEAWLATEFGNPAGLDQATLDRFEREEEKKTRERFAALEELSGQRKELTARQKEERARPAGTDPAAVEQLKARHLREQEALEAALWKKWQHLGSEYKAAVKSSRLLAVLEEEGPEVKQARDEESRKIEEDAKYHKVGKPYQAALQTLRDCERAARADSPAQQRKRARDVLPRLRLALEAQVRKTGEEHGDAAFIRHVLGVVLQTAGDGDGARRELGQAWRTRQNLFGDNHPDTVASRKALDALGGPGQSTSPQPAPET